MFVSLMQDFGWTIEQTGEVTLLDVEFICKGWNKHPPLAGMVGAFLGVGESKPKSKRANKEDMAELARFLEGG